MEDKSIVFRAPEKCDKNFETHRSIFLAGGISKCPNWQAEMAEYIINNTKRVLVFDPRREDFDVSKKEMTIEQIKWEYDYLHRVEAVSFWFCKETTCPITLYELGKITMLKDVKLFIGIDPDYQRKMDIEVQTKLHRDGVQIVYSLNDLFKQVVQFFQKEK